MASKALLLCAVVLLVAAAERPAYAVPIKRIMRASSTNKLSTAGNHPLKDAAKSGKNSDDIWFISRTPLVSTIYNNLLFATKLLQLICRSTSGRRTAGEVHHHGSSALPSATPSTERGSAGSVSLNAS